MYLGLPAASKATAAANWYGVRKKNVWGTPCISVPSKVRCTSAFMKKTYEQYKKHDIPIADAEVKNRFEIRLKNERAFYAIRDLLEHDNPERTAFQIINRYIRFVDRDDTKPRSDWRINEEWAWFMGEHRGSLKLTTKPEPYSFERTLHWLSHQVAPHVKAGSPSG